MAKKMFQRKQQKMKKKKMNLLSQIEEKIRERNRSRAESP